VRAEWTRLLDAVTQSSVEAQPAVHPALVAHLASERRCDIAIDRIAGCCCFSASCLGLGSEGLSRSSCAPHNSAA